MKSMLGGFVMKRILGVRVLLSKIVGLILAESSGLSLGFRGPLIHIAACFANIVSRQFSKYINNEGKKREILSASVAAGLAAAFGAPLGGVLFSLEAMSTYFPHKTMLRSFFCSVMSVLLVKSLYSIPSGKITTLQITYQQDYHWFEIIPFIVIGVLGGLIGSLFIRCHFYLSGLRQRYWRQKPYIEIATVSCLTAAISYSSIYLKTGLPVLISSLFEVCVNLDPTLQINRVICEYSR